MTAVLTPPAVKLLTADEFAEQFADRRFELVRGVPTFPPDESHLRETAPRLVMEVLSPSEKWIDAFRRMAGHLKAGVQAVVILDPTSATASVYRPNAVPDTFRHGDTPTVPDVLPGFSVPVAKLFE